MFLFFFNDPPTTEIYTLSYTTLFRSQVAKVAAAVAGRINTVFGSADGVQVFAGWRDDPRSEEHTSELQSLRHLVCRLLLEKKKNIAAKASQCNRTHIDVATRGNSNET